MMKFFVFFFFGITCLPLIVMSQKAIHHQELVICESNTYRLLEDTVYTNKDLSFVGKIDQSMPYNLGIETLIKINQQIEDALGIDRYQKLQSTEEQVNVIFLILHIDSTSTIKETEFNIGKTDLTKEDIYRIAKALKGSSIEVPDYYKEFSYVKLSFPVQLMNQKYLQ